jgi:hypothetical protein
VESRRETGAHRDTRYLRSLRRGGVIDRARRNLASDEVGFEPPLQRFASCFGDLVSAVRERLATGTIRERGKHVLALTRDVRDVIHAASSCELDAGLLLDALERSDREVLFGMRDRHDAGTRGMVDVLVRTLGASVLPASGLDAPDHLG